MEQHVRVVPRIFEVVPPLFIELKRIVNEGIDDADDEEELCSVLISFAINVSQIRCVYVNSQRQYEKNVHRSAKVMDKVTVVIPLEFHKVYYGLRVKYFQFNVTLGLQAF